MQQWEPALGSPLWWSSGTVGKNLEAKKNLWQFKFKNKKIISILQTFIIYNVDVCI